MTKVLVTGGLGFIGTNLVQILKRRMYQVIIVDKVTYAANLPHSGDVLYTEDICNKESLETIFEEAKPDLVINMAAESHVDNSISNSDPFILTNILGTKNVLDCCRKFGIKLVHFSTDEVYGDIAEGEFNESSILSPSSPYSASKAAADLLIGSYIRTYRMKDVIIVRPTNQYGPYQHKEKMIPTIISCLLGGKPIPMYGNGLQKRNWMYVEDLCNYILCIIKDFPFWNYDIINIPGTNEYTNLELAKLVSSVMDKPCIIEFVKDRPGHDIRYAMKGRSGFINLIEQTELFNGLKKTVAWYEANSEILS